MQYISAFVVGNGAVSVVLRHVRQCPPTLVAVVAAVHHGAVVVPDLVHVPPSSVHSFQEKVTEVFGETLVDVHLFGPFAGDKVAEPMVRQFMGHRCFIGERPIDDRGGIGDVAGVLHGSLWREAIAYAIPSVRPEPLLERVERVLQMEKGCLEVTGIGGLCHQCYRDLGSRDAGERVADHSVGAGRNGGQVCRHGFVVDPMAFPIPASQIVLFQQGSVAPGMPVGVGAHDVFEGAPFHEVVEAREPRAAEAVGLALERNAEIVHHGAVGVEPPPATPVDHRVAMVVNGQFQRVTWSVRSIQGDGQRSVRMIERKRAVGIGHGIHG